MAKEFKSSFITRSITALILIVPIFAIVFFGNNLLFFINDKIKFLSFLRYFFPYPFFFQETIVSIGCLSTFKILDLNYDENTKLDEAIKNITTNIGERIIIAKTKSKKRFINFL